MEEVPKSPPDDAPEAPEPPKREDPDPDPDPKMDWEEDWLGVFCTVEVVACPNMEEEVAGCDAGDENKPPPGVVDPEPPKMEDPVAGAAEVTAEPKID